MALVAIVLLGITAPVALSQTYPSRPVRIVVGFAAGGTTDIIARIVAPKLSERFGQPVIVENRPGGESIIAAQTVANASPDGYTILLVTSSSITVLPHTRKRLPYDPFKDFVHVAQIAHGSFVLAVNLTVPAANVAELIALARSKPGKLSYASGSETGYLTAEMFKLATGTDAIHVPYKGVAPASTDLLSGQVDMMFATLSPVIPYLQAHRLKALAVTGEKRSAVLPGVPTLAESGVTNFESSTSFGISVPSATSPAVVQRLSNDVAAVLQMPDVVEKLLVQGVEPGARTPEQFTAYLRAESEKFRGVLQRIGSKPQ